MTLAVECDVKQKLNLNHQGFEPITRAQLPHLITPGPLRSAQFAFKNKVYYLYK